MHMIRHHHPGKQIIPFSGEPLPSIHDADRDFRVSQNTGAMSGIQPGVQPLPPFRVLQFRRNTIQFSMNAL